MVTITQTEWRTGIPEDTWERLWIHPLDIDAPKHGDNIIKYDGQDILYA